MTPLQRAEFNPSFDERVGAILTRVRSGIGARIIERAGSNRVRRKSDSDRHGCSLGVRGPLATAKLLGASFQV